MVPFEIQELERQKAPGTPTVIGNASVEQIVAPRLSNVKDFFANNLPRFLKCCRCCHAPPKSRNERALIKAREALAWEINLVQLIKKLRYFELSIDKLLPKHVRQQLKSKSDFILINPDESSDKGNEKRADQSSM